MDLGLRGRKAIVCAASRGLGRAAAGFAHSHAARLALSGAVVASMVRELVPHNVTINTAGRFADASEYIVNDGGVHQGLF